MDKPENIDTIYQEITVKGTAPVNPPANMPWSQRITFFADPNGNIHELFAELSGDQDYVLIHRHIFNGHYTFGINSKYREILIVRIT